MDLKTLFSNNIPREVEIWCDSHVGSQKNFVCFLEYVDGEIVERTFAARRYKAKGLLIIEVMRETTGNGKRIVKNIVWSKLAGYTPIFEAKDIYYRSGGYPFKVFGKEDFDVWEYPELPFDVWKRYINTEILLNHDEFKYCGYTRGSVISYIKQWRADPSLEMFGKIGLQLSPVLIKKAKKDGQFRRFLWQNHDDIYLYGVQAALYAYDHKISVESARNICYLKNQQDRLCAYLVPNVKGTKIDRTKLLDYLEEIGDEQGNAYDDYLKAVKALELDLNDTKNVFPKDFRRMHDLRTAQYESNKAKIDAKQRKALYAAFEKKSQEYQQLSTVGAMYSIIIPTSISDLINEGDKLQHCVGKMGYDKKMVDGTSLIAFVRKNEDLNTPFVTVEYRLDLGVVRQCYGFKDSRPAQDVIDFTNRWGDMVTNWRKER